MHATHETEADTWSNRIDPALCDAGWGVVEGAHIHRELICPGRILAGGQHGTARAADYVLSYPRTGAGQGGRLPAHPLRRHQRCQACIGQRR